MIEARDLTKRYGDKLAVDHLSFTVEPGRVTGFLGPNGAGKSTTMRLILAWIARTAARDRQRQALRRSRPAAAHRRRAARGPVRAHRPQRVQPPALPGRRPRACPGAGSTEVLGLVGLTEVAAQARRRFLAGHGPAARHRRGAARRSAASCSSTSRSTASTRKAYSGSGTCMKQLASEGRTVFVSSHLMARWR